MTIIVRAELRALPGRRDDFLGLVTALTAAAAEEPGTVRYAWYRSDDPSEFVVIEEYTDPDAAVAHNQHCADLLGRVGGLAEMTSLHLHGDLGPDLEAWVRNNPLARAHPPLD
jgi:quinol monooxygenase YgiN